VYDGGCRVDDVDRFVVDSYDFEAFRSVISFEFDFTGRVLDWDSFEDLEVFEIRSLMLENIMIGREDTLGRPLM
jgi:hypothetical protein